MPAKPISREYDDLIERARFFEKMPGALHDHEILAAREFLESLMIDCDYLAIQAADDQQGRCSYFGQRRTRQIRASAAAYNRGAVDIFICRSHQRGRRTGTCTKIS